MTVLCSILLSLAIPARPAAPDIFAVAASELAAKIVANMGPLEKVELTFRNLSTLGASDVSESLPRLEREFRARGLRIAGDSESTAKITVTLSENAQSYILVAEVQRDQSRSILMTSQAKPETLPVPGRSTRMAIQVELIFEQNEPILDLAEVGGDLMVLGPEWLSLYRRQEDTWQLMARLPIQRAGSRPRDGRGRIDVSGEKIQLYLPGSHCDGTIGTNPSLNCTQVESPWPLDIGPAVYESAMNFFLRKDMQQPFFTVARARDDVAGIWIFAGVDGLTHIFSSDLKQIRTFSGWGSDIAGIDSPCGSKRQVLVTLPTDPLAPGVIQAFEFGRQQAVDVSSPVEFPGPITALWPGSGSEKALAVSRDFKTGRYAAFQLSVSCGR